MAKTTMCIPLYNDMASVIFGLYENKDDRSPYGLFIVAWEGKTAYIFSTEKRIAGNDAIPYKDWNTSCPNNKINDAYKPILRHEPYIALCASSIPEFPDDDSFFHNLLGITDMCPQFRWPVYKNEIFIVVYKNKSLNNNMNPLMESICEESYRVWREYFDDTSYNKKPPRIDVNEIIESQQPESQLVEFKDIAPFFQTVTKISSLFYEKGRSDGNIALMESSEGDQLKVSFITDTESLSFSIEYAKLLRKLLETAKDDLSLLVYDKKVYGIGIPDSKTILYTFNLTGHMEWNVLDHRNAEKGIQVLRYKHGKYYLPVDDEIRSWYIDSKIEKADVRKVVNSLLSAEQMDKFDHGALLIITGKAQDEVKRLCGLKRGLRTEPVSMIDRSEEECFEKVHALCAIDGSLFLDNEGYCHGIGIILDGEAITDGTPDRGSRYNSTKTYISRCVAKGIEAYALIVSSDGYLDILTTYDNEFEEIKKITREQEVYGWN